MLVLQNSDKIMSMVPSLKEDGLLKELKTVEDSQQLGQFMMFTRMLTRGVSHPNLKQVPGSKLDKRPKFLAHTFLVFDHTGLYILENQIDRKT